MPCDVKWEFNLKRRDQKIFCGKRRLHETRDLSFWRLHNGGLLLWWRLGCFSRPPFFSHGIITIDRISFLIWETCESKFYFFWNIGLMGWSFFYFFFFFLFLLGWDQVDVVLRGYSGYNTRWALEVIEKVFPEVSRGGGAPLAVTVFFGANDACLPNRCSAFQHVPIHEYKQNLHSIVSFLKVLSARTNTFLTCKLVSVLLRFPSTLSVSRTMAFCIMMLPSTLDVPFP